MWQAIATQISAELQTEFAIEHKQQLARKSDNQLFLLRGGEQQFLLKLNHRMVLDSFETEALTLKSMQARHCIRVPDVICAGQTLDHAFLVLEYLPLASDHPYGWQALGHQLAFLHQADDQAMYGFEWDNYLSATMQPNQWHNNWSSFFSEQRIGWLLQLLAEQQQRFGDIDKIVERVRQRLHHHQPKPAFLHGECWRGNIGFLGEAPVVYDPASYYGDRETDLAFAYLFEPLPDIFFNAYQQVYPLPDGFTERKDLYNLYHLLQMAYLRGGRFSWESRNLITQLLL